MRLSNTSLKGLHLSSSEVLARHITCASSAPLTTMAKGAIFLGINSRGEMEQRGRLLTNCSHMTPLFSART